jgi:hypothetical protein
VLPCTSRTDASAAGASLPRRCNVDDDEVAARGFLANRLGRHANLQARCVAGAARDLRRLRNSGRWFEGRSADACWRGLARKLYPEIGDAGVCGLQRTAVDTLPIGQATHRRASAVLASAAGPMTSLVPGPPLNATLRGRRPAALVVEMASRTVGAQQVAGYVRRRMAGCSPPVRRLVGPTAERDASRRV